MPMQDSGILQPRTSVMDLPLKKKPRISVDDRLSFPPDINEMGTYSEDDDDEELTPNTKPFSHQQQHVYGQTKMYPSLDRFGKTINNLTPPQNLSTTPPKSSTQKDEPESDANRYLVPLIVMAILLGGLIFWLFYPSTPNSAYNASDLPILTEHIYSLDKDFPKQSNNFWTAIVSGIKDFYTEKPQKPCVILLFGNIETKKTAECLVQEVANKVVGDMHKDTVIPAFIDAASIQQWDYGEALEELRNKVASQKVLVIKNLQDMKGSVAESLHALCDRYNSAESEALIMFTLHGVPYSSNAAAIAQKILTEQWKNQVPADKLPALVARLTSRVVAVSTENNLPDKCSNNLSNNIHIEL